MSDHQTTPKFDAMLLSTSDEDLLARAFSTDDPNSLDNIIERIPETTEIPVIEFSYDVTPSKSKRNDRPYLWCAHCGYKTHWRGFVMRFNDGTRFLLGKDCGSKMYGADFNGVHRTFEVQRSRQRRLRRYFSAREQLPALLADLRALLSDPIHETYVVFKSDLRRRFPQLFHELTEIARRADSVLYVEDRTRDYAAEQRRDDRHRKEEEDFANLTQTQRKKLRERGLEPKRESRFLYQTNRRQIGVLSGGQFLKSTSIPKDVISDCVVRLSGIHSEMSARKTDNMRTEQIQAVLNLAKGLMNRIEEQLDAIESIIQFFGTRNLEIVAAWASANPQCQGSYKPEGGGVTGRFDGTGGENVSIEKPPNYMLIRPSSMALFKSILVE